MCLINNNDFDAWWEWASGITMTQIESAIHPVFQRALFVLICSWGQL